MNTPQASPTISRIAVALVPQMITTSITLPLEMLEAAVTYSQLDNRQIAKRKPLDIIFCAETHESIRATGGLLLTPTTLYSKSGDVDLVLVPALWRNPMTQIKKNKALILWLSKQHSNNALISVGGTGVAFLAEAGLLNNQPAATHWFYLEKLQSHYPAVNFKPHHLITRSGRIYCAGSVNSVADLIVHLIRMIMGSSIALRVEQQFSHEIRKSFEETCFTQDENPSHQDEAIILLQAWLKNHYQDDISLSDMCRIADLHQKTLSRRFKRAINLSPVSYLKKLRLRQARELLQNSNLSISEIAISVGYNDPDYFSRCFYLEYQLTPSSLRKSVREKLFQLND